jgi:hypothetical protein
MSSILSSQSSFYYSANEYLDPIAELEPSQPVLNSLDDDPFRDDSSSSDDPFYDDAFDNEPDLDDDPNDEDDPFADSLEPELNSMPLPPEAIYNSKDELFDSIQEWAKQYKYAFRTNRSKRISATREKVFYECDRAGPEPVQNRPRDYPRRPRDRVRLTSTAKTGCQFSVVGVQVDDHWELRHRPDSKFSTHNHSPSLSAFAHPSRRRLTKELIQKAKELHNASNIFLTALYI